MRMLPAVLLGLLAAGSLAGGELTAGWQALAGYRADEALKIFAAGARAPDPAVAREARLGQAVALLAKQQVTAGQVDEARRVCTALADGGPDDPALAARFLLGRIAQHHQERPDPAEAARQFRRLIAAAEASTWAQSALSRLALLQLYALDLARPPAERIAAAEKLLAQAHVPAVAGELHVALAEAIFFYRLPGAQALPHLLAAERLGGTDRVGRADVLVQIAELSRLAGNRAQAAKYYRQFLQENPRDSANYTARRRLADMEAPPAAAPGGR